MDTIKIGLQMHSVREAFGECPAETLKRVAEMGYQGVELVYSSLDESAAFYAKALEDAGLECYSIMLGWKNMQPEAIDEAIAYCSQIPCKTIILGWLDLKPLAENPDYRFQLLEVIGNAAEKIRAAGFQTGFHSHDQDHLTMIDDRTSVFDYIFDTFTEDFMLMLDTGNAQGGNADPIALIKKYAHRTEIAHFKGYSSELKYLTPVWEAEIDSDELIRTLIEEGDTKIFSIEFGARGGYEPFERAERSYEWLRCKLKERGELY